MSIHNNFFAAVKPTFAAKSPVILAQTQLI
jgi:hypothetical protein